MTAYYNELDPFAAQWLRELISQGHIAPGIVDERSIEDVPPNELTGFTQCHLFAGVGVWSYALRQAGWPDDRPVWTGSCPCQPFSTAGKGAGFADERHLWPAFHWLIDQCRPGLVLGEQVAGKDGLAWFDLVSTDLENTGYACGAAVTAACGFGAPHQRKRLYWVADAGGEGLSTRQRKAIQREGRRDEGRAVEQCGVSPSSMADTGCKRRYGLDALHRQRDRRARGTQEVLEVAGGGKTDRPGPTNGHWRDADWIGCRDGKWRPVEPGACPLADGPAARVGRLRGYGNAIVAQQAQAFIEAVMAKRD